MTSNLRTLSNDEYDGLVCGLDLASRLIGYERPWPLDAVQSLYDGLLAHSNPPPDYAIAVGLALGDCFIRDPRFEWVRVNDEWGSETVIAVVGKDVHFAPISIVQKRMNEKEPFDMLSLVATLVDDLLNPSSPYADRS